jgi:CDP-paratose 2-epimerase
MKYLITGGCGFLGSNIASEILKHGDELVIFDNLSRFGSYQNLEWLKDKGEFNFIHGDIRNIDDVERVVKAYKPDVIYHLAGQVAMTTSIINPRMDMEVNVVGSFNILNAVRICSPETSIIYSSTNKVYGDLEQFTYTETSTRYKCVEMPNGFDENISLDFHSPYGVSKGSADQYMLDFSRIYGLKTVVFRHSTMFGGRQFATYDQGWIGWFSQQAVNIKSGLQKELFTISGSGKQVRDVMHANDVVELYLKVPEKMDAVKGQAFNIGGGIKNSLSLLELFSFLESQLNIKMPYTKLPVRESDQRVFVADIKKAKLLIDWKPAMSAQEGILKMLDWINNPK